MKRAVSALFACLLLCGLVACGTATEQPTETQAVTEPTEPEFDAQALFKRLEGVWNDDYEIPGFMSFIYRDGKPSLYSGVYDGEANPIGTLIGGDESEEGVAVLYFLRPAYIDEDKDPIPEHIDVLQIDLTDIDDGVLRIQMTTVWGTSKWRTCNYRCKTLQEAGINPL